MDVREKLINLIAKAKRSMRGENGLSSELARNSYMAEFLISNGVTMQEWISVDEEKPTEADGTVLVCCANVAPYNYKEPFVNAKHDRRVQTAHYSEFSKLWYGEEAILESGIVHSLDAVAGAAERRMRMRKTIEKLFCDVCKKEVSSVISVNYPVVFHTEQDEGYPSAPYLSQNKIELCKECAEKAVVMHGWGAQGVNTYAFKTDCPKEEQQWLNT